MEQIRKFFTSRQTLLSLAGLVVIAISAYVFCAWQNGGGFLTLSQVELRQHDMQQGMANSHEAQEYAAATGEATRWTNSLFGGMPTFQITPSYPSNDLFTWLNTVMGLGLPSPANLMAMMMVGFFILMLAMGMRWWLALLGAIAYGFSTYFVIIIGAGHIWKFVTLAYVPPTIAGIVLCYRGKYLWGGALAALFAMLQLASNHVQMTYYFLFVVIGFVVAYLIEAIRAKKLREWGIATGTLVVAALLAVAANVPSLYNTYEYSRETIRGGHSELTREDSENATAGLDKEYITQYSYQPTETFTLLIPNVKGGASAKPEKGSSKIMSLSDLDAAKKGISDGSISQMAEGYLQYMSQYFGDPQGTNGPVYIGAIIVALFLLGCIVCRGPVKWMLIILTAFSIMLAWGRHMMWLTDAMIDLMPMYNKFRTVESILVIAEFTMPLLGMMGLQKLIEQVKVGNEKENMRKVIWSFGIPAFFCVVGWLIPSVYGSPISENDEYIDSMIGSQLRQMGQPADVVEMYSLRNPEIYNAVVGLREGMVRADARRSLVFLLLGFGLTAGIVYRRKRTLCGCGLVALTLIDMFGVNHRYLDSESYSPKRMDTQAPIAMTAADRAILADTSMNYRVMDIPRFNSPDPSYYHKAVGGYHAAKLTRYQDLIEQHLNRFVVGHEAPTEADLNILSMLNTRYVIGDDGQPMLNDAALGNAWFVDEVNYVVDADNEMAALDFIDPSTTAVADRKFADILGSSRAKSAGDTIYETTYAPNRLTYHAKTKEGGVAVFSEIYFPWGWEATIDGAPAEVGRVNYVLRAMKIPAGEHSIEMRFDPPSLKVTENIARVAIWLIYASLVAAIVFMIVGRRGEKKENG